MIRIRIASSPSLFYNRTWTERVAWSTAYSMEGIFIIAGNILALTVFLRPSFLSRKSSYFLISLTAADLLTGVSVVLAVNSFNKINDEKELTTLEIVQFWFDTLTSCASVCSLAILAVERLYAIFWPFKQRIMKTRTYMLCILGKWLLSLATPSTAIVQNAIFPADETMHIFMGSLIMSVRLSCLIAVVISYFAIWIKVKYCVRDIEPCQSNRNTKKLTTTLLLLTILSLATCLPNSVIFAVQVVRPALTSTFFPRQYFAIAQFLMYSNSFANFIIYTCRMKEFRSELAKIIRKSKVLTLCQKCQRNANPKSNSNSTGMAADIKEPTLVALKTLHI